MRRDRFPLSVRVGGRVFWRLAEVREWLAALPRSKYGGRSTPRKQL
jgi:predicted DNA-binding transcriptional regulator AlpA